MTPLHQYTLDALGHKADVARDSHDPEDPDDNWLAVARQCDGAKTIEDLRSLPLALDELENYLSCDILRAEQHAIQSDLCRAGRYEPHSETAVCTRRLKTLLVDGIKYDVG
jgi:hypothetical protein